MFQWGDASSEKTYFPASHVSLPVFFWGLIVNEHQKCVLFSLDVPSRRQLNTTMVNKRGSELKRYIYILILYIYTYLIYIHIYTYISKKLQQKKPGCFLLMLPTSMVPIISAFRRFQKNLHGHQVTVEDPGMDAAKSSIKENKTTVKSNQFLRDQCCDLDWVGLVGLVGLVGECLSHWFPAFFSVHVVFVKKTTDVCCFLSRQQKFLVDLQYNLFFWILAKTHLVDVLKFKKNICAVLH